MRDETKRRKDIEREENACERKRERVREGEERRSRTSDEENGRWLRARREIKRRKRRRWN